MGAVWYLTRRELRSRLGSLVGLALIVAFVTAVVLAGAAGARRTSSVLARFHEATAARDLGGFTLSPDLAADPSRIEALRTALTAVDGIGELTTAFGYFTIPVTDGPLDGDFTLVASPDGYYRDIDRPLPIEGRMPEADAVDEVALNEAAVDLLDLGLGDQLTIDTTSPETITSLFRGGGFPDAPDGPRLTFEVVGIVRTGEELSATADIANPMGIASPALIEAVEGQAGWSVLFLAMTASPTTDLEATQAVLTEHVGPEWEATVAPIQEDYAGEVGRAYRTLAVGVGVFSAIAATAGLLAVGQALTRQSLLRATDDLVARGLGATRAARVLMVGLPSLIAVTAGVSVGAVGSVLLSPLFPLSIARRAETDPGIRMDPPVMALGALLALLAFGTWSLLSAWRSVRRPAGPARRRPTALIALIPRLGIRPPAMVGLRLAAEGSRGRTAVPARSAVLGATLAVAGMVGVAVFLSTTDDALADPGRYGWAWSSSPDVLTQDPFTTGTELVEDDRLSAVGWLRGGTVQIGSRTIFAHTLEPAKGSLELTTLDGRLPTGPQEVALGLRTLHDIDAELGETVEIAGPDGTTAEFSIVGAIVPPLTDNTDPGRGATFTAPGLESIRSEVFSDYLVLTYPDGVDVAGLEADLAAEYGLVFTTASGNAPGQLQQLQGMRSLLLGLGLFLGAIGIVGLLHFLAVSVRRRRGQFAVLRALGFVRRQVRHTVSWQAVGATSVGVVIGVPVGVIVGRAAWLVAVRDIGMVDTPSTPWLIGLLVVHGALAGAAILAVAPGWYAARRKPAELLRAE